MANLYIKENSKEFQVNDSFVQTFFLDPSKAKAVNEFVLMQNYHKEDRAIQALEVEVLKFIYNVQFATKSQIERYLKAFGWTFDNITEFLENMLKERLLNCFAITAAKMPEFPIDAEKYYCLDEGGKIVLSHYYREDCLYWRVTDNLKNTEQIAKSLSTVEFYLAILKSRLSGLRDFTAFATIPIGARDMRVSALVSMYVDESKSSGKNQQGNLKTYFIESVRNSDIPQNFRKKILEQYTPLICSGHYRRVLGIDENSVDPSDTKNIPETIFICEDDETAENVAQLYSSALGEKAKFFIINEQDIQTGIEKAVFKKYVDGVLTKGNIKAFLPKKTKKE